jgi:NADPH2:quinone reductase
MKNEQNWESAMKALICPSFGPAENLKVMQVDSPVAGPGEAVVDVAYAALNFFDTLIIEGKYQLKPEPPFSPAGEFAGRIAALGPGVSGFAVGDRVMGSTGYGAAREQIAIAAQRLARVPDGLTLDKAAGLSVAYGTSLHALKQRAEMAPGETLVVLGASGGVGLAAVEIGAAMGARVIACASSDDKLAFAQRYGAAEAVNYATQDLRASLKALTGGKGVDVVYDPVGGALTEPALRSLAWKGRLLVIGFASGEIPRPPLNLTLLKGCDIRGVYWGEFVNREPAANRDNMSRLLDWAESGRLSVHIHAKFALEDYQKAFEAIGRRQTLGKTLLQLT